MKKAFQSKLYELRMIAVKPEHYEKFLELTRDNFAKRVSHSKCLGYWVSDLGGLNQSVHIWQYDSLAQRKSVRDSLINDQSLKQYIDAIRPMVREQFAVLMKPLVPIVTPKCDEKPLVYYLTRSAKEKKVGDVITCGSWQVCLGGEEGTFVKLCASPEIDKLLPTKFPIAPSNGTKISKLLYPTNFSKSLGSIWY